MIMQSHHEGFQHTVTELFNKFKKKKKKKKKEKKKRKKKKEKNKYRVNRKYSDRQSWAISVDPYRIQ